MKRALALFVIGVLGAAVVPNADPQDQSTVSSELLDVQSGALTLRAQLWRPVGRGPFPAVLFNHGSYGTGDPLPRSEPDTLGPMFARHGYVFLWLHRQGTGLSSAQGTSDGDQMDRALLAEGVEGRNRVQLQLLENDEMKQAAAALVKLRARSDVDTRRISVIGHSLGGSLTLLMAAQDPEIRAVVIFGGASGSWNQSPPLRARLLAAVGRMSAPAFFIHAQNDYSTAPGRALAAKMRRLGKIHTLKIYPPYGTDRRSGHNLVFRSVGTWEADVFGFLDEHVRR